MSSMDDDLVEESLSQVAWQTLRSDIISGQLPADEKLRISKLRESYGIGASPLREALSRLVADGFVIAQERRGFYVAPMSLAEFRDLTDLRKLLEKEALRVSLEQGDDIWEGDVLAAFHRLSKAQGRLSSRERGAEEEWEALNEEFHERLVSACTSQHLLRFRRTVYAYTQRYRRVCLSIHSVKRDVHDEHKQLCEAALARDTKRVCRIVDSHLEATYRKVAESGKLV